ncbi:TetR/AcrR family transcriptional regulator [Williamsia maris]|uniref:Transcriptional regulator, TetR family n=2 Tax=Williamsia maris TaxID=72806 RepID=A0ABT1HJC4_9NOCA|nr:transcriptional regulator, TetR family [Williamsia maris]
MGKGGGVSGRRDGFLVGFANGAGGAALDDPEATRIAEAAIDAVAVLGWSRLTMSDVARRAKVGRATLYRYFAGKDELRNAILQYEMRRFIDGSTAARAPATSIDEALTAGFTFTLQFLRNNTLLDRMRHTDRDILLDAICDDELIATAREFSAQLWKLQLYPSKEPSDAEMAHLRTVSEITTRLSLSLIVNPDSIVDFDDPTNVRSFAHRYLAPLVTAVPDF